MCNELKFNDKAQNENYVASVSINYAKEVTRAFKITAQSALRPEERLTCWTFPFSSCIKINTDGSSSLEDHRGGFGGLVRTDQGKWVEGFCGYIRYADALKAELWGIRHALKLCKQRNWRRIVIEIDCLNVVNLIKSNEGGNNHPNIVLINDRKDLIIEIEASLVHILRQANKCANVLAHKGSEQSEQEVRMLIPLNEVVEEMLSDIRGVAYGRST